MHAPGMSWRGSDSGTDMQSPKRRAEEWANKHRQWAVKKADSSPSTAAWHTEAAERYEKEAKSYGEGHDMKIHGEGKEHGKE